MRGYAGAGTSAASWLLQSQLHWRPAGGEEGYLDGSSNQARHRTAAGHLLWADICSACGDMSGRSSQ